MAVTTEITDSLPTSKVPTSHTPTATTITFAGTPQQVSGSTTIAASGVVNASAATGYAALQAAVKSYIDTTYIPDVLKLDETETVSAIITITNVTRDALPTNGNMFATHTDQFTASFTIRWE